MFNPKMPAGLTDTSSATNARSFSAHAHAGESNCSIINEWLTMRGDLESDGDILVKGKVQGNIQCKLLIIDAEAMVEGAIFADDVVIRGTAHGIIQAHRVRLEKSAIVDSQIFHDTFSAEEGAHIKGALRDYQDYVANAVAPAAGQKAAEKTAGTSFYQLLDQARTAHHAHLAVAQ